MRAKTIIIAFISILFVACAQAQTPTVDRLKLQLYKARNDSTRLNILLALADHHHSINRDSLDAYAYRARLLALRSNNRVYLALANLAVANAYFKWGWTDSARAAIEPSLALLDVKNDSERSTYLKLLRQKALCYGVRSQYDMALPLLYKIVDEAERYNDSLTLGANFNTIGSIAIARNYPKEGLNWFKRALEFSPLQPKYFENLAAIYTNMGNAYSGFDNVDSSLACIDRAIPLARQAENLNTLATALRIKSNILLDAKKLPEAELALQEMLQVRSKTNPLLNDVDDNLVLIDFYINSNQIDKAINLCLDKLRRGNILSVIAGPGIAFSNDLNIRLLYYEALAKCYKIAGRQAEYQQTLEKVIEVKDSTYQASSASAIAEAQQRYEVQKKETTIIQQNLDITRKDLDITRKNYLFYGSLLILALAAIISWQFFRNYSRKQRLNMLLMQQEEKRLAGEQIKDAEEKERKRIAADLHDNLGAYAAAIASNLDYISALNKEDKNVLALHELRNNSQSIVSQLSDTIWALKKESLSLTAISDRLKVFLQRMCRSYPGFELHVVEKIQNDFSLPPSQAFHLFQIVQESVTNAIKHSGGNAVEIEISSNNTWSIIISDNGMGIDPGAIFNGKRTGSMYEYGGNGLLNIKSRATDSGWKVTWENERPGTKVIIESATPN